MACIASIRAFTDPKDYELIVVSTEGYKLWDGHKTLSLENCTYIQRTMENDQGNSADMNEGAKLATGEYVCFVENDVTFHENWLPTLRYYLEHDLADAIIPAQYHTTWENVQKWKSQTYEEGMNKGLEEAGVLMMRKDKFEEAGGWDERIKKVLMWKAFMIRLSRSHPRVVTTYKTFINHIGGVSYWWDTYNNKEEFDKITAEEIKILGETI